MFKVAQKNKTTFDVRVDSALYRKLLGVCEREGCTLNNYMIRIIRSSVDYSERVHGRLDISKYPAEPTPSDETRE